MQRVLIIEDQEKIRKLLVDAFRREGYKACNGIGWKNAEEFLKENMYDLVVADLEGKSLVDFGILKTIKLSYPTTEVVTIFQQNEFDMDRITSYGVYDYVLKPFVLSNIVDIGKKALEKKQLADKVRNLEQIMDMGKLPQS